MKFPKNETTQEVDPTVKVDLSTILEQAEKEAALERANRIAGRILFPVIWMAIGFGGCLWLVALVNR